VAAIGRVEAATKYPPEVYGKSHRSQVLTTAALGYAARGWPVLPCNEDKEPLIKDWPSRATTNQHQIRAWWERWPNANVAIVTGGRSGILALDVDNPASLDALEAEHGPLPATRKHGTGSGGVHHLFHYPVGTDVRNSASKIATGLDVRGERGYIIAPPSRTTRPYALLDDLPLANAPAWLLEKLRSPHKGASGSAGIAPRPSTTTDLDGPPIPEGTRNDTLASIAGRLHNGTRHLDTLAGELQDINAARCAPPLPDVEVWRIAASIYGTSPCSPSTTATPEALEALAKVEAALWTAPWPGMGGRSERDTLIAAIKRGRLHGKLTPAGVRISLDYGTLALEAGVSKRALLDYWRGGKRKLGIISRLKRGGWLRSDNAERKAREAGAFIISVPRAQFHHSTSGGEYLKNPRYACGETLRAPRLRWGYPGIKRLGKTRGAVIDTLEAAGSSLTLEVLADALHHKRPRDMRRRVIPALERHGMVECVGDRVRLTTGYLDALERRREATGEIAAETRDRERNKRKTLERRERLAGRDTRIPVSDAERAAVEELREIAESEGMRRSWRAQRRAMRDAQGAPAGEIAELESAPEPEPEIVEALAEFLRHNPHRTTESPSWLAVAVWAHMDLPVKPAPNQVESAMLEIPKRREGVAA
jgi:Bifunctional DNA primase/polymerase, N-terminal/Primase C terminal 1 (PriCT-1)